VTACRERVVSLLVQALCCLLPSSQKEEVYRFAERIADKAIALKNDMTEEQALYFGFWRKCGQPFDAQYIDIADEVATGILLACTFPGLARTIKINEQERIVFVVKASGVSETAFSVEQ
jgi:hypothetical protein